MVIPAAQQDPYPGSKRAKRVKRKARRQAPKTKPPSTGPPPEQPQKRVYGRPPPPPSANHRRMVSWADLRALGIYYHPNHLRRMWMRNPPDFPVPFKPTPGRLAWWAADVEQWLKAMAKRAAR